MKPTILIGVAAWVACTLATAAAKPPALAGYRPAQLDAAPAPATVWLALNAAVSPAPAATDTHAAHRGAVADPHAAHRAQPSADPHAAHRTPAVQSAAAARDAHAAHRQPSAAPAPANKPDPAKEPPHAH